MAGNTSAGNTSNETRPKKPLSDWDRIAAFAEFKDLLAAKARFIVPATIFFIVYYFALPVSVGYFPDLMKKQVLGVLNLAYLFALSQFFVAWGIAFLYMRKADQFDKQGKAILDRLAREKADEKAKEK
jgi:uncharacterized membrane protein (DUF485 family)